jgi:beta-phosphoglucomutase family hydrolase
MTTPTPNFGVLWDMDGVLVDTGEFHVRAWQATLEEMGIAFSREQFQQTFGMNNRLILETLLGFPPSAEMVVEVGDRKEALFRKLIAGNARALPGVREWLARFKGWRIPQALASSAPCANIDFLVDALGLRSYFDQLLAGDGIPGKPAPDLFLMAAQAIGQTADRCIVIEDAIVGVEAARRAGMKCIAVTTTNPPAALAGADLVIARLDQLTKGAFLGLLET